MPQTATVARTDIGLQFPARERHALGISAVPAHVVTRMFDVEALLDTTWRGGLASGAARPNLLIQCSAGAVAALTDRLRTWATHPLLVCRVTADPLRLPVTEGRTLLVHDVAALTVPQQIELDDWTTARASCTQVIGITSVPLAPLVEAGHFLQALFDRMNVLRARASA